MEASPWPTYKSWHEYGIENDYDKRNPKSLERSPERLEKAWYKRGNRKIWLKNFPFARECIDADGLWSDYPKWERFGYASGYDKRTVNSLAHGNKIEKSWYWRGTGKGRTWHRKFPFKKAFVDADGLWPCRRQWLAYGKKTGYDKTNYTSVSRGTKLDRAWLGRGVRMNWASKFPFVWEWKKYVDAKGAWPTCNKWWKFGKEKGYDKMSANDLKKGDDKVGKSWYIYGSNNNVCGTRKTWTQNFPFARKKVNAEELWPNRKIWVEYGNERGNDKLNPTMLKNSESDVQRSWYNRGRMEKWLRDFPFERRVYEIIARSPKLKYISKLPLSTAEQAIFMRATKEFEGRDYSVSDIQEKLPSKPRLNLGPLNLGRNGIYDIMVDLARKAPEVYTNPDVRLVIMNRLNRYYYALHPDAKHNPAVEEYVIQQAEKDFARLISNVKTELAKQ